jgi:hypothetical protein
MWRAVPAPDAETVRMDSFWLILFATTAGFTASGIIANLYRVCGFSAQTTPARVARSIVMIFAGPSVIFETAMRGFLKKEWSRSFFWLVAAGLAYWSLAIGLFVMDLAMKF